MVDVPALLPCPFCGGEARKVFRGAPELWVSCHVCNASGPMRDASKTAIVAWNTRATSAEVAALRAHVAKQARIMAVLLAHASSAPLTDEDMQWARAQVAALEPTR